MMGKMDKRKNVTYIGRFDEVILEALDKLIAKKEQEFPYATINRSTVTRFAIVKYCRENGIEVPEDRFE
jgi:hypothetical protein